MAFFLRDAFPGTELSKEQMDELLREFDTDKSGTIGLNELHAFLRFYDPDSKTIRRKTVPSYGLKMFEALGWEALEGLVSASKLCFLTADFLGPTLGNKALVVIDVQNDFISGTLAVQTSEEIVSIINNVRDEFDCAPGLYKKMPTLKREQVCMGKTGESVQKKDRPHTYPYSLRAGFRHVFGHLDIFCCLTKVVISYDWHPQEHCSFVESANDGKVELKEQETPACTYCGNCSHGCTLCRMHSLYFTMSLVMSWVFFRFHSYRCSFFFSSCGPSTGAFLMSGVLAASKLLHRCHLSNCPTAALRSPALSFIAGSLVGRFRPCGTSTDAVSTSCGGAPRLDARKVDSRVFFPLAYANHLI